MIHKKVFRSTSASRSPVETGFKKLAAAQDFTDLTRWASQSFSIHEFSRIHRAVGLRSVLIGTRPILFASQQIMCMGVRIQVRRTRIARKAVDSKRARVSERERDVKQSWCIIYTCRRLERSARCAAVTVIVILIEKHSSRVSHLCCISFSWALLANDMCAMGILLLSRTTSCFSRRLVLWRSAFFTPHLHFCLSAAYCRERKLLNARLTLDCLAGHAQTQPRWVEEMRWNTWGKLCDKLCLNFTAFWPSQTLSCECIVDVSV